MNPILKKAAPLPDFFSFERYLFVGPHPDDIEVGCAPTVAKLVKLKKQVDFLIVCDDSDGSQGVLSSAQSGTVRQKEAQRSAELLGVNAPWFLSFRDGGLYTEEELIPAVAKAIALIKPDVILTADPNTASECHADHIKTGRAVRSAFMMCGFDFIMKRFGASACPQPAAIGFYYTDRPNTYVPVRGFTDMRDKAMACHESQFSEKDRAAICMYYRLRSLRFGLKRLRGACDGYRLLGAVHAHCFPEASQW